MTSESHFRNLENMYAAAPINGFFEPTMTVSEGKAIIEIELSEKFHHAAGGVHGSVYFKMLDDAAFFAANSIEHDVFVLTTVFTTYFTRPVSMGKMRSVGSVVNRNRSQIIAESIVYNSDDIEIGRGSGVFVRSKQLLTDTKGYGDQ